MLTAPNGLNYRLAETAEERRAAFDYAVLFNGCWGGRGELPQDVGLSPTVIADSLRYNAEMAGGLVWVLAFAGDLMVGGIAVAPHVGDLHGDVIVAWNAPGFEAAAHRINLQRALVTLFAPGVLCGCSTDARWRVVLAVNSVEYLSVQQTFDILSEELVERGDRTVPTGLIESFGVLLPGEHPMVA